MSRIYVGKLPTNVRAQDIEDIFDKYGSITEVAIKGGRGTCYAFVTFRHDRAAQDAVEGRDNYDFYGNRLR